MSTEPLAVAPDTSVVHRRFEEATLLSDYWQLTKPDINLLIAITTGAGFYLGSSAEWSPSSWMILVHTVLATVLAASGAAVLNQRIEYPFDARMRRTARRAIAAGRIDQDCALTFGIGLSLAGVTYLRLAGGILPAALAVFTLVSYVLCYTPLKRLTTLCTLVGAVPGATPALIGWTAARGHLDSRAWVLFSIVFLWQLPHFMSIAWMYRDDYDRAGYLVLPTGRSRAVLVILQTLVPLVALLPASLLPVGAEQPSAFYSTCALLLGFGFLYVGVRFARVKSGAAARRLLMASIIYLPALLALMMVVA